ncbi:hypothetical protein AUC47_06210 [Microbacterium sp. SZ1]|uniref:FAD-dependent oxidoreductase n=1 Tax=Microbacterium sp. SZ1 TaxID=1849736 RepID=UPI000BBC4058|nr:NAD(P)/FAD-dependent oxidoreductase [Microbacterium sp. SZ1]PCE14219.1 hypothetical protein AUC47_06210 [Microbacterium sp. SZ1]
MPAHEVMVVGGGPVGLLFATLLVQQGVDAVVFERRGAADTRTRAIGIHPPGLDALDAAGVGAAVRSEALVLDGGEVRSRRRLLAAVSFDAERPVHVLAQPRTDALLRARLRELSPEALRTGRAVRSLRDDGREVTAQVEGAEGAFEVSAAVAVVADGVHSGLRRALGAGWRRRPGSAPYAMLDADDPEPDRVAVLHCEPEGLVESFPLPGGRRRWVLRQGRPAAIDAEDFRARIMQRTGIRPPIDPAAQPARFLASQHVVERFAHGRIALLGDAAREISPIGGQGMNLGWSDAVTLADIVGRAPRRRFDLEPYARAARRSAVRAQRRSAFYMSMGAPATGTRLVAREALMSALGARPMRGWTAGLITMRGL